MNKFLLIVAFRAEIHFLFFFIRQFHYSSQIDSYSLLLHLAINIVLTFSLIVAQSFFFGTVKSLRGIENNLSCHDSLLIVTIPDGPLQLTLFDDTMTDPKV